jgi:hypothetical protein
MQTSSKQTRSQPYKPSPLVQTKHIRSSASKSTVARVCSCELGQVCVTRAALLRFAHSRSSPSCSQVKYYPPYHNARTQKSTSDSAWHGHDTLRALCCSAARCCVDFDWFIDWNKLFLFSLGIAAIGQQNQKLIAFLLAMKGTLVLIFSCC